MEIKNIQNDIGTLYQNTFKSDTLNTTEKVVVVVE